MKNSEAGSGSGLDRGVYVAVFYLPTSQTITVGRLGRFELSRGFYFYVGTAQQHLSRRLERHNRRNKRRHWHIDYLSTRAVMLGALVYPGPKALECKLAAILASRYDQPIRGFGCSDCRCSGHLFYRSVPTRHR